MESNYCKSCGKSYIPGEAGYCTKCGEILQTKDNLIDEIKKIEREPKPYESLRFTSGVIVFFGRVVIVLGWFLAITIVYIYGDSIAKIFISDATPYRTVTTIGNTLAFITFIFGFLNTIFGIFLIASGQIFMALLDIRNDAHTTMRLVRRFGLLISEENNNKS